MSKFPPKISMLSFNSAHNFKIMIHDLMAKSRFQAAKSSKQQNTEVQ